MWHCNSHGHNRSSIRADFLAFTAHVRSWLGSPNFCIFLSSPKADKVKSFIALGICAGYLWENIPIVGVCRRDFSTPSLKENFRMVQMTGFICSLKKGLCVNSNDYCAHVRDYNFVHKCKGTANFLFQRMKVINFTWKILIWWMNMRNWNEWQFHNSKTNDLHQVQEIKGKTSPEMYQSLKIFSGCFYNIRHLS